MNVIINWVDFQLSQIKILFVKLENNISRIFLFRGRNRWIHWRQIYLYYRVHEEKIEKYIGDGLK